MNRVGLKNLSVTCVFMALWYHLCLFCKRLWVQDSLFTKKLSMNSLPSWSGSDGWLVSQRPVMLVVQPMLLHMCKYVGQNRLGALLTTTKPTGVAAEVNLRNQLFVGDKACKREIHPGFETRSLKHGYQWPHKMTCHPRIYFGKTQFCVFLLGTKVVS